MIQEKINKGYVEDTAAAKSALWYLVSTVIVSVLGMISAPIFTRMLTKEAYGTFNNYIAIEGLLLAIVSLQLQASIAKAKYDFSDKMDKYISTLILTSNTVGIFCWMLVEMQPDFFSTMFSMEIEYIRIMFLSLIIAPTFLYIQAKHRIYIKYKMFTVLSVGTAILRMVASILLVMFLQNKIMGRIIGYVFPMLFVNLLLWIVAMYKGKGVDSKALKYAATISLPIIPHALANSLLASSDTIMITKICGSNQTALYTLAYTISALVNSIWLAMNQAWAPWMYDKLYAGKRDEVKGKATIYVIFFVVLTFPIMLIAPELVLIFGGEAYREAKYVIPPVIMGFVAQLIYSLYVHIEIYMKKTLFLSVGTLLAAGINICLNILLIPRFGYLAAAYTTLIGYFFLMIFHYLRVKQLGEFAQLYENKKIFVIFTIFIFITFFILELYKGSYIRFSLLGIYIIVATFLLIKYRYYIFKHRR